MKKNLDKIGLAVLVFCLFLIFDSISSADKISETDLDGMISKVEKSITLSSELFDQGKIKRGSPYVVDIFRDIQLSFSEETFDADQEKAFAVLEKLMMQKKQINADQSISVSNQTASLPDPRSSPNRESGNDRIGALRQKEKQNDNNPAQTNEKVPLKYSAYKNYQQARQEKILNESKAEETDMHLVASERQAAGQNQQRKREKEQLLQAQATKWQEQLDKQASASARAAASWEAEHSFGAYAKSFLGMVIQTSVGAFTGGLLGTVSTNLANKAVHKLFPNAETNTMSQAASAGTSSAITSTAAGIGQSVSQGITSSATGQQTGQLQDPEY